MATAGLDNLSVLKITRIFQALQDPRERTPANLRWSRRTPRVPALDGELFARFIGRVLIADLIADDSAAGVYSSGKMTFESHQAPKIKIGRTMTESQLRQLEMIRSGQVRGESQIIDFVAPIVSNCLMGIDHRIEALCIALLRDRLDYDRLGFKANGISFGMPSDLKVTAAIPWTSASTATPIDDILNICLLARIRYGIEYNRVTMSTQAFRYAIATTEFQNKAKTFLPVHLNFDNLSLLDLNTQMRLFQSALGGASDGGMSITVELADERYWYQDGDGSLASARFQPINEVILDSTANDNNSGVKDLAAGLVIESMLMGLTPGSIVGANTLPMAQRGPIGYLSFPPDLNPPNVTVWGVDVAFPRRHLLQQNALLTVGAFTDTIAVGEPF